VLDSVTDQATGAIAEALRLAEIDPDLEHAVNVATYAAIFAMAFGKIDPGLIADLALAGLLHDVGVCRVDAGLAAAAWKNFRNDQRTVYADHVEGSLALIHQYAPQVPDRVKLIIHQHHEKFDGTGYPRRLSGFQIDDVAQLVSMSDFLHAMTTGKWDGQERTLRESFETLEKLEKARTFPEYFNPDVYAIVIGWIRSSLNNEVSGKAADVVLQQVKDVMNRPNKAAA
jgi:HD-GYP domain-containing protein (c-di-GMP phosphodiesterase class II)